MKREERAGLWARLGFAVTSLLGTLLHFLYEWTGSPSVALVSAVNESTWEHMKLLFFPMLSVALLQYARMEERPSAYWCIKARAILLGLLLIPVLFYTLGGVFGTTSGVVNIAIFFAAVALAYRYEAKQFRCDRVCTAEGWAVLALCVLALAFFLFTFRPPALPLFRDPLGGGFGI